MFVFEAPAVDGDDVLVFGGGKDCVDDIPVEVDGALLGAFLPLTAVFMKHAQFGRFQQSEDGELHFVPSVVLICDGSRPSRDTRMSGVLGAPRHSRIPRAMA
ncbi:hypothetical protein D3C71_1240860 [compost metagenome]